MVDSPADCRDTRCIDVYSAAGSCLDHVRKAISDGADYAEIDVQTTSDGVVVLMHDGDLMRIASVDRKINEITFDELMEIDIGSWFSPAFRNERIAKLTEVIDAAKNHIKLNIELKYNRSDPALAEKVVRIIREKSFTAECLVSSLDYRALTAVKSMAPEIKTGFIVSFSTRMVCLNPRRFSPQPTPASRLHWRGWVVTIGFGIRHRTICPESPDVSQRSGFQPRPPAADRLRVFCETSKGCRLDRDDTFWPGAGRLV